MSEGFRTPAELAVDLEVEPIAVRHFLRRHFPRSDAEHGQRWTLTAQMSAAVRVHFAGTTGMGGDDDHSFELVGFVEDSPLVGTHSETDLAVRLNAFAAWSAWIPFAQTLAVAPRLPGVYMAREAVDRSIVYIGMAGERRGNGLRGRLAVYTSGKAVTSGLGEAVFDRALADEHWLGRRLAAVEAGSPARAREWGRLAFERADLEVCWTTVPDRAAATALERSCLDALADNSLWNRLR